MNAKTEHLFNLIQGQKLPEGWTCEVAWPYRDAVHLVPANRKGGVIVQDRSVRVQLPDDSGICAPFVYIKDAGNSEFKGRGWQDRIVQAAVDAAFAFTSWDPNELTATTYVQAADLPRRFWRTLKVNWVEVDVAWRQFPNVRQGVLARFDDDSLYLIGSGRSYGMPRCEARVVAYAVLIPDLFL